MAGSWNHCIELTPYPPGYRYRGVDLLEGEWDFAEAVDQLIFMVDFLAASDLEKINEARDTYYRCLRGEEPRPEHLSTIDA